MKHRLRLEPRQDSARAARILVARAMMAEHASSEQAVLLTSELASNVVQHAHTSFEIVIDITQRTVRVELHDGAAATHAFRELFNNPPTLVDATATAATGRGLGLMRAITINCGLIDKGPDGKAVWSELPLNND